MAHVEASREFLVEFRPLRLPDFHAHALRNLRYFEVVSVGVRADPGCYDADYTHCNKKGNC